MNYIQVGKVVRTHGIKGELAIVSFADDMDRFKDLKMIYLGDRKVKFQVERVRFHKNMVLLKFEGFNNINEVLSHVGKTLYVDEEDKRVLPEDHFFISDIIGSLVYDTQGNEIGIVADVNPGPGNDIYIIKNEKTNKEHLIPAVKEFIKEIDIENKKIIIDPIEGMIE